MVSDTTALPSYCRDLLRIESTPNREEAIIRRILGEMRKPGYDAVHADEAGNMEGAALAATLSWAGCRCDPAARGDPRELCRWVNRQIEHGGLGAQRLGEPDQASLQDVARAAGLGLPNKGIIHSSGVNRGARWVTSISRACRLAGPRQARQQEQNRSRCHHGLPLAGPWNATPTRDGRRTIGEVALRALYTTSCPRRAGAPRARCHAAGGARSPKTWHYISMPCRHLLPAATAAARGGPRL